MLLYIFFAKTTHTMGFKRENYTLKGICVCVYFLLITNTYSVFAQTHCPVRVEYEPRETNQSRSTNSIDEVKFPFFQQWEDLENVRLSDDERASVYLPSVKRSTVFKGKNFGFDIPNGASISGIEMIVEGHTSGEGFVEGQMVRLLDIDGQAMGNNQALQALPIDEDWTKSNDTTDFVWRYGSPTDTWGLSLSDDHINNSNFGYAMQVRNKSVNPVYVHIDHIEIIVYYTPLYEICSTHACVPFYIDEADDPLITYEWYIPEGFELISQSEEDEVINIGVSYADFGEYEICVEAFYKSASLGLCCRKFNYVNCNPSLLSGQVFLDADNSASNNTGDSGVENFTVNLHTDNGTLVGTTSTDDRGEYSFSNLSPGQYYIEVEENIDSLIFTEPDFGSDDNDSDITEFFGPGTTDLINLISGDSLTNIDAGLIHALSIGDFAWEDLNGDGIQQENEPGIEGINVQLTDSNNNTLNATTDSEGYYLFEALRPGNFSMRFQHPDIYIPTLANTAPDHQDSDNVDGQVINLSYTLGGKVDSIDAGYYKSSTLGDFVWEDLNANGIQDEDEPGLEDVVLELIDSADEVVNTTTSDQGGNYSFSGIAPGEYYIRVQADALYSPTQFQSGGSADIDSDLSAQDGHWVSPTFTLASNTTDLSLDFGFIQKPATVGGFTFLDANNNGQYESDETFVPGIEVTLYDINNTVINTTFSDIGGLYVFENIAPGSYYVVFELPNDQLFTGADIGDDLSDSDVNGSIGPGSTSPFVLGPDEENYSISAGYQDKPKVGDYVWLDENANGIQDEDAGLNEVEVELYNALGEWIAATQTANHPDNGTAGYYQFSSLEPGTYYIKVATNELYDFAIVETSSPGENSSITHANGIGTSDNFVLEGNDCKEDVDAGYAYKKGNIQGEVWIDIDKDGIQNNADEISAGVVVKLYDESGTLILSTTTNTDGQYFFSTLDAGNYYVVFEPSERYRFTNPMATSDTGVDSDVTGANGPGSTDILAVTNGSTLEDVDAGLVDGIVTIEGQTWIDDNGDGTQQEDEEALAEVRIELFDADDELLESTSSDVDGNYSFSDLTEGDYYIVFTPIDDTYHNTLADQGGDDMIDDDVTSSLAEGSTDLISILYFQDVDPINAGYFQYATIGDQVFIDVNENHINDDDLGLNNVVVNLLDGMGSIIASDTTAQGGGLDSGYYLLENIRPGAYVVQFVRPLFYQFVEGDQGGDDSVDSDAINVLENTATTAEINITSGSTDLTIDAGLFYQLPMEASIEGVVWVDTNANGIRDNDEPPRGLIPLILRDQGGNDLDTTFSDVAGKYRFENLPEGFYSIQTRLLGALEATFPNIGSDDSIDSDFIEILGECVTEEFFLANFEEITNIDLGLSHELIVGDFVWEDSNNNGIQDSGEIGIEEVEITITSDNGLVSKTVMSDADGAYQIADLPAGHYRICAVLPSGFHFAKANVGSDLLDSDIGNDGCTEFFDFTSGGTFNDLDVGLTKNGSIEGVAFVDLKGNGIIDANDPGLDDIVVNLHDASGQLIRSTTTTTVDEISGVFEFNNLQATDYYLVFEFPEEYNITSPDSGPDEIDSDITGAFGIGSTDIFALPSGAIVTHVNGGAYLPASIGDRVWMDINEDGIQDADEEGVADIQVIIFQSFGLPFDTTYTDEDGYYTFDDLNQGLYFVQFIIPQEYAISPANVIGSTDEIDSDADDTGKTPLVSLAHGADVEIMDCGIYPSSASLRSVVWHDVDGDGMRQSNEARIPGIRVSLYDDEDNLIESTETNSLGLYAFQQIPEGEYKIFVDLDNTDYAFTTMNMDASDMHDSDINPSGESEIFTSDEQTSQLSVPNIDAGLYESGGIVTIVWEDQNANGIFDMDENPFVDAEASLYAEDGLFLKRVLINEEDGSIEFDHLLPGNYFIVYDIDKSYVQSPLNGSIEDDGNSDVSVFEGFYVSPTIHVMSNEVVTHIDAGFYKGASINSTVWYDLNKNGLQDDEGETPQNIYATVYDKDGKSYATRGINPHGQIKFTGIPMGEYYVRYYASETIYFTDNAADEVLNNDVNHSNGIGTTSLFNFSPYASYDEIDAGLIHKMDRLDPLSYELTYNYGNEVRSDEEMSEMIFEVHPNPAANYIKIKVDEEQVNGVISIYNSQNHLVYQGKVAHMDMINLSEYHPGIYYIKYDLDGRSITKKILKIQ